MKRYLYILFALFCLAALAGCSSPAPTSPGSSGWVMSTNNAFSAPSPEPGGRYGLCGTVFNNAMWAVGGASSDASASVTYWYGDVWSSGNGSSWTQATGNAAFGGRYGAQLLTFNGKMWLIGGNQSGSLKNDVWTSTDGITWIQVLPQGPASATQFSPREDFGALVFNNALWVIGGWAGSVKSDVWTSVDGITWSLVSTGGFTARWGFSAVSYNNQMWLMGGATGGPAPTNAYSDVWSSPDGVTWTKVSNANIFANLYYSQAVVNNNQIVLSAGDYFSWGPRNYVFTTVDGVNWGTDFPSFPIRFYHLSLSFNNQVWIIGGMSNVGGRTYYNDVWHSP